MLVPDIDEALAESPIMVEEILGQRDYYSKRQYLVRWAGWLTSEATWEAEDELLGNSKLALYLNRKAVFEPQGGSWWIQQRRSKEMLPVRIALSCCSCSVL